MVAESYFDVRFVEVLVLPRMRVYLRVAPSWRFCTDVNGKITGWSPVFRTEAANAKAWICLWLLSFT